MKKLLSILLVMMMVFTFISCGNDAVNDTNVVAETEAVTEEVTEEATEEATEEVTEEATEEVTEEATEEVTEEATEEVTEEATEEASYYPITFTDGMGREVTIESEPMTIVSLTPSMTETIYALGFGDRLVGRTDYCNYPEAAAEVASIGSLTKPNLESIIAINPDLILMSKFTDEEVLTMFEEAGLNVAVQIGQENFDGVYEIINQTAMIFDATDKATELVTTMQADVAAVVEAVKDVEKKTVYYVVSYGEYGEYTATGDTFIHEMLELAGGSNVASDGEKWSYNLESLIQKDPEVLICSEFWDTKITLEQTEGYMDLTAVKEGRLLEINPDILSRQGPRLAEGLKAIASLLHPEIFE